MPNKHAFNASIDHSREIVAGSATTSGKPWMRASLPPEITVVETSDAISYELPVWPAGRPHRVTVFCIWGGLLLCCGLMFTVPVVMTWAGGQALEPVLAIGFFPVALLGYSRGAPITVLRRARSPIADRVD